MEYRNPTVKIHGAIECEIKHPRFGWIPFSCVPNDTGAEFNTSELYHRMLPHAKREL